MDKILNLIQDRRSSETSFDVNHQVAKKDLLQILEAGRWTPTAHNMQNFEIVVIDDKKLLEAIGNIKRPISETFIRENYQQLSFSEEELLRKKTGLLGTMFPPSWRNPDFKLDSADEKANSSMQRPFPTCPVMLIVVFDPEKRAPASEGDFLGILSLGCVMENMWLMAHSLGIGFQILSSLSSDVAENEIKKILNIPEKLKVAFTCRLGYPDSTPSKYIRVRRDIKDFVHLNKYSNMGMD